MLHDHDRAHTLAEVAEALGLTVGRCKQIESVALRKVRIKLEERGIDEQAWRDYLAEQRARDRHREAILVEYARRWREAAEAEPVEFRKANAGRFAANAWLKEVGRKNHPPGTHRGFAHG